MKALVTGVAGFMGSHVAEHLLKSGVEVTGVDDLSGGFEGNIPKGVNFYEESINDAEETIDYLCSTYHFDYIYHLAAYAAEGLSHFIKRFNYQNNLIGSVNLINAAVNHGVKCFVFTSSIAVYGSAQTPMSEAMIPQPEDSYGIAKYAVEQELKISHEMFGLNYVIFRPHNVYGPRQNIGDRYRNVAGIFMNQLLKKEPMTIFGDGEQARAFTYIDDVAPIIAGCVNAPEALNQVFNIGADVPVSVNRLAQMIADEMGVPSMRMYLRPRKEVKNAFSDHAKLESVFGKKPHTDLQTGIRRMLEWVKAHGAKETKKFAEIEIHKNIPEHWLT